MDALRSGEVLLDLGRSRHEGWLREGGLDRQHWRSERAFELSRIKARSETLKFNVMTIGVAAAKIPALANALRSSRVLSGDLERVGRRVLITVAAGALVIGVIAWAAGFGTAAKWIWGIGTASVASGLLLSMARDVLAGRVGVDVIAFVSMAAAVLLGETLAGVVVAVMYAGGNVLEDFAVGRAERELKSLVDRAPRVAHRLSIGGVEDVQIERITIGN